ncbi:MAG: DUF4340 domain-containing protein [Bacteroidota bacterium]|nr:DUF4340 domain-containing protein [Bacteroidota bacterium]
MNRNIILILVLVIAGGIAWYVWKNKPDEKTTLDRTESNFKIDDVNTISRILITNKDGTRSDLKRVDDQWIINDQHRARQSNVEHLLKGINRQHLDYIPNKAATEGILKSIAVNGIHVEIFDLSGNPLLTYYLGGVTQGEGGTFFLKEGSTQPYTLIEPGFAGGLRARYALRPTDWRDIHFWVEDTESIDTLKVDYPKEHQHAFILIRNGNNYNVEPLYTTTPRKKNENQVKIKSYLTTLSKLACENFLPESAERDSIIDMLPFIEMNMIYKDKSTYLNFFPVVVPEAEKSNTDIPRFFIDYGGKDFMIAQQDVIKGAFRSYEYFFE